MKIVGVTVTYGERHEYCLAALGAFFRNGVDEVVLISNGSTDQALAALRASVQNDDRVSILHNSDNEGSAPAFSLGMAEALSREADWIWILDDDNVPADGALHAALATALENDPQSPPAMSCVRDSDESHMAILRGLSVAQAFPPAGSFFGVDVFRRIWGTLAPRRRTEPNVGPVHLPQSPYGGLLLTRKSLVRTGLPREEFILYFDDVEFTRRLVQKGTPLVLATHAQVRDQGNKWADNDDGSYVAAMINSADRRKIFYSYRNSTLLDWKYAASENARLRFVVNFITYSTYVLCTARTKNFWFSRLYLSATFCGFRGRLGESSLAADKT